MFAYKYHTNILKTKQRPAQQHNYGNKFTFKFKLIAHSYLYTMGKSTISLCSALALCRGGYVGHNTVYYQMAKGIALGKWKIKEQW